MDSRALSRIQSLIIVAMILVSVVGGSLVYFLWRETHSSVDTIKIGICGDLDTTNGRAAWLGAILAAEQINAEGGILGRNFEIVAEDDDSESSNWDLSIASNAINKLITLDKADCIIAASGIPQMILTFQDICAQHKRILFSILAISDTLTLRVSADYSKYKYFFRAGFGNETTAHYGRINSLVALRNYTGFNKVAYLYNNYGSGLEQLAAKLEESLIENGFEITYGAMVPMNVLDFSSYLSAVEESGAEILTTMIFGSAAFPLVSDWYDRQLPFVLWGVLGNMWASNTWDTIYGKCEFISTVGYPITSGYPLTSKTLSTRNAYIERWDEIPTSSSAIAYDIVKFILPDAIKRANTIETEALIDALEQTDIETSSALRFVFTSNHDTMKTKVNPNDPEDEYIIGCYFQWQNGEMVPVYPQKIMEESGATYLYPPWSGPWDNIS